MEPDLWSGNFYPISLHGSIKQIASDMKNIKDSLNFMARYISNKKVNPKTANDFKDLDGIGDAVWNFISLVYQSSWDSLYTDNKSKTLREKISAKFTPRIAPSPNTKLNKTAPKLVSASIVKFSPPPPLPVKTAKEVNTILKYFQNKNPLNDKSKDGPKLNKSYAQASKPAVSTAEVLKIKKTFPALSAEKIDQINNIVNGSSKPKPRIQTTTKGPSRKQVIIPMSKENINSFIKNSSLHITSMNRQFWNAKSEILVDYIRAELLSITVVTNKVAQSSDLMLIDQYIKNSNDVNTLQVEEPRLPKSKSYLKIIGILYYPHNNSQERLTSNDIKTILKQNQIFDNISLASKPWVIKVSPKSDMSIVWIDIWDVQSGTNTKMLINRCFNVGEYIATIQGANMNPGVPSARTAGNRDMPLSRAEYRAPNMSSVTVLTNPRITESSDGATNWRKVNHALTHSNAWTAVEIIKPTPMYALSGAIVSTGSGRWRSILRSVRTGQNLSVLKEMLQINNEFEISQNSITKCLQKCSHCPNSPWESERLWHHLIPRTPIIRNPKDPEFIQQQRRPSHWY